MANLKHTQPQFRKDSSKYLPDVGKSRTAYWEAEATTPQTWQVKLINVKENATFELPANTRLHGDITIFNNSAASQAAITIGTAAAGTQVDTGATVTAATTVNRAATDVGIDRTGPRTIYVESAAWQDGVHIVLNLTEYPPVPDATALS